MDLGDFSADSEPHPGSFILAAAGIQAFVRHEDAVQVPFVEADSVVFYRDPAEFIGKPGSGGRAGKRKSFASHSPAGIRACCLLTLAFLQDPAVDF